MKHFILIFLFALALFSCSKDAETLGTITDGSDPVLLNSLNISSEVQEIQVGSTLQLNLTLAPENATNKTVLWSSSDLTIAEIDQNGSLKGIAPGAVTIMVKSVENEALKDSAAITVLADKTEFVTTWSGNKITIPTNPELEYDYNVDWDNDFIIDERNITGDITHIYEDTGDHTIRISGTFPSIQFVHEGEVGDGLIISAEVAARAAQIKSIDQWGTGIWQSMEASFFKCVNLTVKATDVPNFTQVQKMNFMFAFATNVNPDVSKWETGNVTSLSGIFFEAVSANPQVNGWATEKVTNMDASFMGAATANPDVSSWNISNVTSMLGIFAGSALSTQNYEKAVVRFALHNSLQGLELPESISLGTVPSTICAPAAIEAKAFLENEKNWTIADSGECNQ